MFGTPSTSRDATKAASSTSRAAAPPWQLGGHTAQLERYTPNSIVDRDALIAELAEVRKRGWSLEQEQGTVGVVCIATVVPYRIPATDALSVSMPAEVTSYPGEIERIAGVLTRHAESWARELRAEGVR